MSSGHLVLHTILQEDKDLPGYHIEISGTLITVTLPLWGRAGEGMLSRTDEKAEIKEAGDKERAGEARRAGVLSLSDDVDHTQVPGGAALDVGQRPREVRQSVA